MKTVTCAWATACFFAALQLGAQVEFNPAGTSTHPSAIFELTATDKGMLIPRMTTAERNAIPTPAPGLLVFDITTGSFWFFNDGVWVEIPRSYVAGTGIAITDFTIENTGDTNPNNDITFGSDAGGDLAGVYPNPVIKADAITQAKMAENSVGTLEIINNTIKVADLDMGVAANGLVLTATGTATAAWQAPAVQKIIADADNDTKIQVEESADEDIIRFDLAGTERLVLRRNASGETMVEFPNTGDNLFLGTSAGGSTTTGDNNTAIGKTAMSGNTTGGNNTAVGAFALSDNTTVGDLTAVGAFALGSNTTGTLNTAVGAFALSENTIGSSNTAVGHHALQANIDGADNTAVGYGALTLNTGESNTAIGSAALQSNTTGVYNTATGVVALLFNSFGEYNTANGAHAMHYNTSGNFNTATGYTALYSNTEGEFNTANGSAALYYNSSGDYNTAGGRFALFYNTNQNNNTGFGYSAGDINTSANSTFLGYNAYPSAIGFTNCMGLGYNARPTGSNVIHVGNASITTIAGQVNFTTYSDRRFKQNVSENVNGLDFILRLRPVTYNLDVNGMAAWLQEDKGRDEAGNVVTKTPDEATRRSREAKSKIRYTGFIAQEVEAAAAASDYEFSGVDKPQNETGLYGLRYAEFVVPLVKGMQEQQVLIEKLEAENAARQAENANLKAQLDQITAALQAAGIQLEK